MKHLLLALNVALVLQTASTVAADEYSPLANIYFGDAYLGGSSSPCASGSCPLTNSYGGLSSYGGSSFAIQQQLNGTVVLPASSVTRAIQPLPAVTQPTSTSTITPSTSPMVTPVTIQREQLNFAYDFFVTQPVHDVELAISFAQPVAIPTDPPWVQPESEILDSQPGVDPYDVGCGPEPDEDAALRFVAVNTPEKPIVSRSPVPYVESPASAVEIATQETYPVSITSQSFTPSNFQIESIGQMGPMLELQYFGGSQFGGSYGGGGGCASGNCRLAN